MCVCKQEESEAAFRRLNPDWSAPFANLPGMDDGPDLIQRDEDQPPPTTNTSNDNNTTDSEASEAQAASAAAKQLLNGAILTDIVNLHAAVFTLLSATVGTGDATAATVGTVTNVPSARERFLKTYQVCAPVLAALAPGASQVSVSVADKALTAMTAGAGAGSGNGEALQQVDMTVDRELDDATRTGNLYR